MKKTLPRLKDVQVSFRVTPEFKKILEACADADSRSVSNYIVALVKADAARRGLSRKGTGND